MDLAQEKQEKTYKKRMGNGVKVFDLKEGDTVYRRIMKNISRKGGKMEHKWSGPFR